MKSILCYGDSNTWGYDPATGLRFDRNTRWTGVLQDKLGRDYHIIEEGLCGRTTVWQEPFKEYRCGKSYLIPCLETHKPIDLVILMLGTNDLKSCFNLSPVDIAMGAGRLIEIIEDSKCGINFDSPEILLVIPPPLTAESDSMDLSSFKGGLEKSQELGKYYRMVAKEHNCHLFDSSEVIESSNIDGVHIEAHGHESLGRRLADIVKDIF